MKKLAFLALNSFFQVNGNLVRFLKNADAQAGLKAGLQARFNAETTFIGDISKGDKFILVSARLSKAIGEEAYPETLQQFEAYVFGWLDAQA